jgi:outer membrane biosynthesis protein TonB
MDNKSLSDDLSQFISGATENKPAPMGENIDERRGFLVDSLKVLAGLSGESLETAVNDFLGGKGELHEATQTALTRGGDSALSDVGSLLTKQFNLSPAIANLVASLLVKLMPSLQEKDTTGKTKPRRKSKTTSSAKKAVSRKKPKKKTSASKPAAKKKPSSKTSKKETSAKTKPNKKTSASKPAAKKQAASKTGKKEPTTKKKPKKVTRTETMDASGGDT